MIVFARSDLHSDASYGKSGDTMSEAEIFKVTQPLRLGTGQVLVRGTNSEQPFSEVSLTHFSRFAMPNTDKTEG